MKDLVSLRSCSSTMRKRNGVWFRSFTTTLVLLSSSSKVCRAFSASSSSSWKDAAQKAVKILSNAQSILFVTGAGISAESGLPTYRGVSGLYTSSSSAALEEGMSIEECLSASTYKRRPDLTWKYLLQIETSCRGAEPSHAHKLVAQTEMHVPGPVTVMTQNIDGLHNRAGSSDILSLHGELYQLQCDHCNHQFSVSSYQSFEQQQESSSSVLFPPICPSCGTNSIRPRVVLFDECLSDETVTTYQNRLGYPMGTSWLQQPSSYDVSICIGTSALFSYVNAAALSGTKTIEINPTRTDLSPLVDVYIPSKASESLDYIYKQLGWIQNQK